jgi:hypothetical protein
VGCCRDENCACLHVSLVVKIMLGVWLLMAYHAASACYSRIPIESCVIESKVYTFTFYDPSTFECYKILIFTVSCRMSPWRKVFCAHHSYRTQICVLVMPESSDAVMPTKLTFLRTAFS